MEKKTVFLVLFLFVSLVALGSVAQAAQPQCGQTFQQYAGDKGYMNQDDFKQYWSDAGHTGVDTMGNAPVSGADTAFDSANTSGNQQLSMKEFCAWVNRP